ncbi:unnamed protein product [Rotaria sp. Silwood1]|nr:unnamed protein product [Rotaria sp. Silwood1]CAF1548870.1 unnamed protein product [Rotaria sp. Silwood1]CAF4711804.1 unnamed protein product [Rotaria sp. Silwood1]
MDSTATETISNNHFITDSSLQTIKFHIYLRYRNVFEQFSEVVRTHYPNMIIIGENYPISSWKIFLTRILFIIKILLFICILLDQNFFLFLNISTPKIYLWALENKIYACLIIFFLSNSFESYLITTGAFEISINDISLWSKFETGRLPTNNEFIQILQKFITN